MDGQHRGHGGTGESVTMIDINKDLMRTIVNFDDEFRQDKMTIEI